VFEFNQILPIKILFKNIIDNKLLGSDALYRYKIVKVYEEKKITLLESLLRVKSIQDGYINLVYLSQNQVSLQFAMQEDMEEIK